MVSRKKKSKKRQGILSAKFLVTALIIIAVIFAGWQIITTLRSTLWDGQSRANWVVDAENIYLFSFEPEEKELLVVGVPSETSVETPYGSGFYPFGSTYELGEIDKKGGKIFTLSAQEYFAAPIDGWMVVHKESQQKIISDPQSAKNQALDFLRNADKTNLTFLDRVRLWWQVKTVRVDKVKFLNLDKDTDSAGVDFLLGSFLVDEKIRQESLKVEILNSTGRAGLGAKVGRLITNLGGSVITVDNSQDRESQCLIKVSKENLGKKTVQRLKKIFSCQIKEDDFSSGRVDLTIIIGSSIIQAD